MVTKKIDIHSSTTLQELVSQIGMGVEIILFDGDKPVAKLLPPEEPLQPRIAGLHEGAVTWISDDFDEPLPDEFWLGEEEA